MARAGFEPDLRSMKHHIRKKKGIFTPEEVANEEKAHNDKKQGGSSDIDETYDIDEINRRAIMNDDFDI